jgi:hypothetical protein
MTSYRIAFYKTLYNSAGMPFKCVQAEIAVTDAASPVEATTAAEREFERSRGVCSWKLHADYLEIEPATKRARQFTGNPGSAASGAKREHTGKRR